MSASIKTKIFQSASQGVLHLLKVADKYVAGSSSGLNQQDIIRDPYENFKILRNRAPILRSYSNRGWLVLGFEQAQAAFKDTRFSSDLRNNKFLSGMLRVAADGNPLPLLDDPAIINLDAPDHTRLRKLIAKAFSRNYILSLAPSIQQIIDELLANIDGEFDLVEGFAKPLPILVIAHLMGLPEKDYDLIHQLSDEVVGITDFGNPEANNLAAAANLKLLDYFSEIIEQKRKQPGQDLISQLIAAEEMDDRLTAQEMYSTCILLLIAGHETTTRLISNGLYTLLQHPQQRALLAEQPELMENAIEEMLRFEPPVQLMPRYVTEDMTFYGQQLKRQQILIVVIGSANRDETANTNADNFDITRQSINHIGFGHGVHLCLGMTLARLEAKLAFTTLLQRFPSMTLAQQNFQWNSNALVRGLVQLYIVP